MMTQSFLQLNTIFISILIEAFPFVLIGVLLAGIIQMFVSEQMIARMMPKNPILAILFSILIGALFPACECGIVPVVRRLIGKGVPSYAGIAFMLTAPVINPIVLFSSYIAFGNSWEIMLYRGGLAVVVAFIVGLLLFWHYKDDSILLNPAILTDEDVSVMGKIKGTLNHAVEEFFSVGKYLILGAFVAAAMQTYVKTSTLLAIGQNEASGSLVMMGLAFVLSLCSEADAFIASSFRTTFSTGSLVAFLVFGPMVDIKNTLMMLSAFKKKSVFLIILYISMLVFIGSLFF
ncbi:hypothetical protein CVD28_09820 [Bacillus sp. M6-12]|uniref:permease n=1 Tax=Bacillus sp. M6-12 TaxID=2054166 RepID=UPI000C78F7B6|nr:permease [Bacillus sp. M6-12]PLS17973.1 hypothetical protein CVD28_09820 [Bacillus sp. M6-12]